ncbi:MAG TPA: MarR family transcriptional regulator [Fimbriimonas sp.]
MVLADETKEAFSTFLIAHAVVTRMIDRRLKEAGVVGIEVYDVLLALEDAPERRLRMSELADRLVISRSGITRLVDRLEKDGLLKRVACPMDRRAMHAALTDHGLAERERAWPVYRQAIAELFGQHTGREEAETLRNVMRRIIQQDPEVAARCLACGKEGQAAPTAP